MNYSARNSSGKLRIASFSTKSKSHFFISAIMAKKSVSSKILKLVIKKVDSRENENGTGSINVRNPQYFSTQSSSLGKLNKNYQILIYNGSVKNIFLFSKK